MRGNLPINHSTAFGLVGTVAPVAMPRTEAYKLRFFT
jgi:hypothetical protein